MVDFVGSAKRTRFRRPAVVSVPLFAGGRRASVATKASPARPGSLPAVIGPLHNPSAFVFSESTQECDEPATYWGGQIKVGFIQNLDQGTSFVDAFDQVNAIHHRASGTIPFGDNEDVASSEFVDRSLELWAAPHVFAGRLLAEDGEQPSVRREAIWRSRFWAVVDTRAYPIFRILFRTDLLSIRHA